MVTIRDDTVTSWSWDFPARVSYIARTNTTNVNARTHLERDAAMANSIAMKHDANPTLSPMLVKWLAQAVRSCPQLRNKGLRDVHVRSRYDTQWGGIIQRFLPATGSILLNTTVLQYT